MGYEYIEILGARENNLKNINVKVPKGQITIFTGVSGSGKSSIVFDTIAQEAGRQLNETLIKSPLIEGINTTYLGLVERFIKQNIKTEFEKSEASKKKIEPFTTEGQCDNCLGKRYNDLKNCKESITARYL
jgi:excinuclease UvrABC ATPase subunit